MVSLSLMARLIEAVRPDARLILVGDPGQLASIEAGAVLGDIVGPAAAGRPPPGGSPIGDGIVVLDRVHRFGGGIAELAEAIRGGDADTAIELLAGAPDDVTWIAVDVTDPAAEGALVGVRDGAVAAARRVVEAARAGATGEAIEALGSYRLLCAHRRGPHGVAGWTARIEGWLAAELADSHEGAAVHGGDAGTQAADRGRDGRGDPSGGGAAGGAGVGARQAVVG